MMGIRKPQPLPPPEQCPPRGIGADRPTSPPPPKAGMGKSAAVRRAKAVLLRSGASEADWIQIEMAAKGCGSGTSDEWPALVAAIARITGRKIEQRKSAAWLQGFCEGVLIQAREVAR